MAATHYNTSVSPVGAVSADVSPAERLYGVFNWLKHYRAMRRAERDLLALDDRLLDDIGIERVNIHNMVWNGRKTR